MRNAWATKARRSTAMTIAMTTSSTVSVTARRLFDMRDGLAGRALLLDLRGLPAEITQVVQLRPTDIAHAVELDLADDRRVHRERALDADAEAHLADGEGLAHARALAADHDALEDLQALARALDHAHVDLDGVARVEGRHVVTQAAAVDEIGGVHGASGSCTAQGDVPS